MRFCSSEAELQKLSLAFLSITLVTWARGKIRNQSCLIFKGQCTKFHRKPQLVTYFSPNQKFFPSPELSISRVNNNVDSCSFFSEVSKLSATEINVENVLFFQYPGRVDSFQKPTSCVRKKRKPLERLLSDSYKHSVCFTGDLFVTFVMHMSPLDDLQLNSSCSVPLAQATPQDLFDVTEVLNVPPRRWMWGYWAAFNVSEVSPMTTWQRYSWQFVPFWFSARKCLSNVTAKISNSDQTQQLTHQLCKCP